MLSKDILLQENDLITPAVTSLENIGKIARIEKNYTNVTVGGFVYIFRTFKNNEFLSKYINFAMSSPSFVQLMKSITKKSGQAFYNMNKEKLLDLTIPVPPMKEQERIIEKIEFLESNIIQYEKLETELYELDSTIKEKLKKSILQYAIQGKLVKQDPNDEPASVLLERIKAEKEQLIKEGKIKREKNESIIYQGDDKNYYEKTENTINIINSDLPYIPPASWILLRFKSAFHIVNGFTPNRSVSQYWNLGDIPWMTVDDINVQGKHIKYTNQFINKISIKSDDKIVKANSVFICCTSATIGKTCINYIDMTSNQQFNGLTIKESIKNFLLNDYVYLYVSQLKPTLLKVAGTTTFPFVSVSKLGDLIIPIPPINYQIKAVTLINNIDNLL